MIRLFRLTRLVKMYRRQVSNVTREQNKLQAAISKSLFFVGALLIMLHILACAWIGVGYTKEEGQGSWLIAKLGSLIDNGEEISLEDHFRVYILSLYFVFQTFTTVGYGDVNPTNTTERIFLIFLMFLGATAFALATGQISAIMTTQGELTEEKKVMMGKLHKL